MREKKVIECYMQTSIHDPVCPTFTTLTKLHAHTMTNERLSSTNKSLKSKTIMPQAHSLSHTRFSTLLSSVLKGIIN